MLPALCPGDEVLLELRPARLRVGDLVAFRAGGKLVVHRVIRAGRTLVTRGDNVLAADAALAAEQVVGRAVALRRDGRERRLDGAAARAVAWVIGWASKMTAGRDGWHRAPRKLAEWLAG